MLWPDAEARCFGSFATALFLPESDMDVCILSATTNHRYKNSEKITELANHLQSCGLYYDVVAVIETRVPIIKLGDKESGISIDISFERTDGLRSARLIVSWVDSTPVFRELLLVLKMFLYSRNLHNVRYGGLGGYSTACLVYAFLKMHGESIVKDKKPAECLGKLLLEFFKFYGPGFPYLETALVFDGPVGIPSFIDKASLTFTNGMELNRLTIQDPNDFTNNLGASSYNLMPLMSSFGIAYEFLVNRCYQQRNRNRTSSIIGSLLRREDISERQSERDSCDIANDAYEWLINHSLERITLFQSPKSITSSNIVPQFSHKMVLLAPDEIVKSVIEHLCVTSDDGLTFSQLWSFIRQETHQETIDEFTKKLTWRWLYENPDFLICRINSVKTARKGKKVTIFDTFNKVVFVDYSELIAQHGEDKLRLKADPNKQSIFLTGCNLDDNKLGALPYELLKAIAKSREKGITSPELIKTTGQDMRSLTARLQTLESAGLIKKFVYIKKVRTFISVHTKYLSDFKGFPVFQDVGTADVLLVLQES
ncbi:unnamed protein product [Ambrosiozyma monospora]|uniref:Unnamed protein product n=1 Tax=Ambrosiozyma monospora TaxID=43982 RepID=A0ACB5TJ60_AMBMO|nr:unnamed protein product [Ambrosiozyma monospora]